MNDETPPSKSNRGRAVPTGRLSRLGTFGRLAGGVAGGMLAEGARRLASGERPKLEDLILTPANATRVADRLSHLRGAAMKLGQMISMDAGDLLPPELTAILARLRNQAYRMPPPQLDALLKTEWGADWRRRFTHFEATPIAAASIGQVHRATLPDGCRSGACSVATAPRGAECRRVDQARKWHPTDQPIRLSARQML